MLAAVTVAEGNRAGLHILATSNQGEGHLFLRGVTDLLTETIIGQVNLHAHALAAQLVSHFLDVVIKDLSHRYQLDLHRS